MGLAHSELVNCQSRKPGAAAITTIAVDAKGCFAADTQLSGGVVYRVSKLFRLPDGGVISACGTWATAYAAIQWFLKGEEGECPAFEGAQLMFMRPDGVIWMADEQLPAYPLLSTFAAIGSGSPGAMTAMHAGKSAQDAVEAVTQADRNTSGPVEVMRVQLKRARK